MHCIVSRYKDTTTESILHKFGTEIGQDQTEIKKHIFDITNISSFLN